MHDPLLYWEGPQCPRPCLFPHNGSSTSIQAGFLLLPLLLIGTGEAKSLGGEERAHPSPLGSTTAGLHRAP